MPRQALKTPLPGLAAHARMPSGRIYARAGLRANQRALGGGDPVVMLAGPDAGSLGIVAPTDYPVQPGSASMVVLLDGRAVVVPTAWVGERL